MFDCAGVTLSVKYLPAESDSRLFGGNSNWRGPIWFPVNYLLIELLQKFHHYYGDDFKIECPTGSGNFITIEQVAEELTRRLMPDLPARRAGQAPGVRRPAEAAARPAFSATTCCSTSTSTATAAGASAPRTRPAGPA